jgi:hypothetical protein
MVELAENPTLRALRDYFRFARQPEVNRKNSVTTIYQDLDMSYRGNPA